MVDRGHDVEFEFSVRGRLEDARVDFDLLYTGSVEFFQCCYNSCFLACARGPVDEEMGEVAALSLRGG